MNDFQKKRLAYFIKAARNFDWVRLGPGDVEILGEAEVNEHNYKAADSWEDAAMTQMNYRLDVEGELGDAKEEIAHHLRRIERFKKQVNFLNNSLKHYAEEAGDDEEELELMEPDDV